MIIDSQVHCYERNHPGRPWVGVLHGPKEATGDQMVAAMDEVGVDGAKDEEAVLLITGEGPATSTPAEQK